MKKIRAKSIVAALMAGVMLFGLAGCGAGDSSSGENTSSDNTITIWATGSDNVRQVYETLVDDFNTNSDYAGEYTAELQFMLSGTGTQSLTDMLVAAQQAGQTDTDYDLVDLGGDDLSNVVSRIGEDAFVKSMIPKSRCRGNWSGKYGCDRLCTALQRNNGSSRI